MRRLPYPLATVALIATLLVATTATTPNTESTASTASTETTVSTETIATTGAAAIPPVTAAEAVDGAPDWFRANMAHLVAEGDRWITDNSSYKSDDEPWDQYGLEWAWGIGKQSVTGRLFGLSGGRDVTFWEFRMFWHPGRNEGVLQQFGTDGTFGEGWIRSTGSTDQTESIQTFTAPDGTARKVRHLTTTTADIHDTRSLDEVGTEWQPRRRYVWHRTPR